MPAESTLRDRDGAGFELIETMRWEPECGFVRFDRHLARLYGSAHALGFACDPERLGETLRGGVGARVPLRVRLALSRNGDTKCVTQHYEPLPEDTVWTLRIAKTTIDADDTLIAHKTTLRSVYMKARSEFTVPDADEVVLANRQGEICEGTITSLFVDAGDGGPLWTPPLRCGLLAGVLRGEMIDEGKAVERVLTQQDLRDARAIFAGNSLRGLIPARLA